MVGVGEDGEEVLVYLGQAQPSQGGGDDGLRRVGHSQSCGGGGLSHLCDQFSVGLAAPRIVSGRHGRLGEEEGEGKVTLEVEEVGEH